MGIKSVKVRKVVITGLVCAALIFLWLEFFSLYREAIKLSRENDELSEKIRDFDEENSNIERDIAYFTNPHNLQKLLRERLNYKKPGEKMIIIVPER